MVLVMPKLTRNDDSASSADRPIASSVGLGSTVPDAQAEPVETAKPARSSRMVSASPSTPATARCEVLGSRGEPWQWTRTSSIARRPLSKRSRIDDRCACRASSSAAACSAASPKPTIAATFSVEARRRRSWPPPSSSGASSSSGRIHSAAAPSGPWNLCAPMVRESTPKAATSTRILPAACTASQWTATPALRHSRATSATGCSVPISFEASIRADQARVGPQRGADLAGVDQAGGLGRHHRHRHPERLELARGGADRRMLERRDHQVTAAAARVAPCCAAPRCWPRCRRRRRRSLRAAPPGAPPHAPCPPRSPRAPPVRARGSRTGSPTARPASAAWPREREDRAAWWRCCPGRPASRARDFSASRGIDPQIFVVK